MRLNKIGKVNQDLIKLAQIVLIIIAGYILLKGLGMIK